MNYTVVSLQVHLQVFCRFVLPLAQIICSLSCHLACAMGDRADTTASPSTPHGGVDRDDDGEVELQMNNALIDKAW